MTAKLKDSKAARSHNRLQAVLDAGAKLFATKGYKATTMRDIATDVGMQPGSLYYHFASKQDLLLAVYELAVTDIMQQLDEATEHESDAWLRFEAAVVRHIETILDKNNYAKIMTGVVPDDAPDIKKQLTTLRDAYENKFKALIEALPLTPARDKKLLRLMLLGAINSTQLWYRPGANTPEAIGREFVALLRQPLD